MRKRKTINAFKFATVVMAAFTVYFAAVGLPAYPSGISATWDNPQFLFIHTIIMVANLVSVLGFFAYFQKPGLKELAREPKDSDKFIDYVRMKKEEGSWSRAFIGFSFMSMGFISLTTYWDWKNPLNFICFFMGALALFSAVWITHESYYQFLKKIKNFLPHLRRFVRKRVL